MDQGSIVTLVVGAIVAVLGFIYRYYKPLDPVKSWLEMGFAIIGAVVVTLILGKASFLTDWSDPVKTLQFLLETSAVLYTLAQIIYSALQQAMPQNRAVRRAFSRPE